MPPQVGLAKHLVSPCGPVGGLLCHGHALSRRPAKSGVDAAQHDHHDSGVDTSGDDFGYQGRGRPGVPDFPPGWIDGAPTTSWGQSCAICGTPDVAWVHPLDPSLVRYRAYSKGHTLPGFWPLCQRCESLYQAAQDEALVAIMKSAPDWMWDSPTDIDERLRKPLAAFRHADKGARPLASDPDR